MTTFTISVVPDEEDGYLECWMLCFDFKEGSLSYRFDVHEPYIHTKQEWLDLAEGKILYCGNGEGNIKNDNDDMVFVSCPSAQLTIPRHLIVDKLKTVIEEADKKGFRFHTEVHKKDRMNSKHCSLRESKGKNGDGWKLKSSIDSDRGWRPYGSGRPIIVE